MTIHVNIGEAKTRLSELIAASERGEEVIIARAGKPVAKLQPVEPAEDVVAIRMRAFGMFKDRYDPEAVEALTAPLSEEELAEWFGPLFPKDQVDQSAA